MNIVCPVHFKETTTSPAFTPHQQWCFSQDVFFSKAGFRLLSIEMGDCSPGAVPKVVQTATCSFSLPVMGALMAAGGGFPLRLCVSVPNVQVSIWAGSDTLTMAVLSSLGLGLPASIGVCVSTYRPSRGTEAEGDRPPPTTSIFPLPPTASVFSLSTGAVNLRVKLLIQHTWQSCSFKRNPVKIKHLSIPEAGALISQLLTFLTCKAEDNNFLYETGWDVWLKGLKPRRVNFY